MAKGRIDLEWVERDNLRLGPDAMWGEESRLVHPISDSDLAILHRMLCNCEEEQKSLE